MSITIIHSKNFILCISSNYSPFIFNKLCFLCLIDRYNSVQLSTVSFKEYVGWKLEVSSFKFTPYLNQIRPSGITENLGWKIYFFQNCSQNWLGIFLKFNNYFADSRKISFIHLWCIELCARPVHTLGACLWRARPVYRVLCISNE